MTFGLLLTIFALVLTLGTVAIFAYRLSNLADELD